MWSAMRASNLILFVALFSLAPAWSISATDELPDDEFLEFLGVWDEAWSEACEPDGGLPGDDACLEYDDDDDEQENADDADTEN